VEGWSSGGLQRDSSATDHTATKRTERDIIPKMKRGRDEQSDGAERKILMGI
jgi:hypothetical protein